MLNGNKSGRVVLAENPVFNGVKIFSATMMADREQLGARINSWLASAPDRKIVECIVTQSSDEAFHCVTLTFFYYDQL